MIRHSAIGYVAVLAVALFSGSAMQNQVDAASPDVRSSHVIPVNFRGIWAESPAACLSHNDRRYEISAIHFGSASIDAKVRSVQIEGDTALAKAQMEAGDFTLAMTLVDGNEMRARIGERDPVDLMMCR
ncbi:hypothetical protein OZN62_05445 [Aurantiacibacter sp. MUD11]|uniref:hypothetical protein n=1 Tax=Aurantiacibacter sp. MUD11 TaxID=3003265 RepID=UPI0022AA77AC|nr:hypothetical protein [Aurantiacibacter sp. MUD11]WAT19011.1 hypothetical protein OZN62_05445 [Aurantiacibacter sp. MUD11]